MISFEKKLREILRQRQLLLPGERVLCGVSGGADSVALLLSLSALGYPVRAAHCNFHLRGAESDRDETFIQNLCQEKKIPLRCISFDTNAYQHRHKMSMEAAARKLRYDFFRELCREWECTTLCVAHHQGDQAETVLLNLLRGSGIKGLCGMRPRNGIVARPLLDFSKAEILAYLEEKKQPFVTDSTNLQPVALRNRLRLQVLPLLSELNPSAIESLCISASHCQDAYNIYAESVHGTLLRLIQKGSDREALSVSSLMETPSPRAVLHEWLAPKGANSSQIEQLLHIREEGCREILLPYGRKVSYNRKNLILWERADEPGPTLGLFSPGKPQFLPSLGKTIFSKEESWSKALSINKEQAFAFLDFAKLSFPLTLRLVEEGDRFTPFGMRGSKLVSDYLCSLKMEREERKRQVVLCSGKEIAWLIGLRVSNHFAVDETTHKVLILEIR